MKQVLIRSGRAVVEEVPAPQVGPSNILVRVEHSCISVGTELAGVKISGTPLYQRALKHPEAVLRVLDMARHEGLNRTIDKVRGKLAAGSPTGYSAAGVVIDIGSNVEGFGVGDRVACAGAGIANHAEIIDVPVNLAVKLPASVGTELGSTVTLGAIALQGVRRAQPTLGETFVVVGLGILGQLTCQLLTANGCRVVGVDIDPERIRVALDNGIHHGIDPRAERYVEQVLRLSGGFGADGAIVTASGDSDEIISEAMQSCRRKGRVVIVGDVGLGLNRADLYRKELDVLISSSYGPGRYDPFYEEGGQDYPLPYVRWTENRNMQAYLELIADGNLKLGNLCAVTYPVDEAGRAYESLLGDVAKPLMVLLSYPNSADAVRRTVRTAVAKVESGVIGIAVVGAGGFAQAMHLPNLIRLRERYRIVAVAARTGATAKAVATQFQATYATTDYGQILTDPEIDLVMISTRHNLHGTMVLQALRAGKHVFVEKPLALTEEELAEIEHFYRGRSLGPVLMTGFNRRFSPAAQRLREVLATRATPLLVNYRMNAGYIPREHWVQTDEGGGRNLGEACHIYDLFRSLTGSPVGKVHACAMRAASPQWLANDNFVATLSYEDGSVCSLTYTALGNKSYPKERMDVFADGKVISLDDYKALSVAGGNHKGWQSQKPDKGHSQELEALAAALAGGEWPIPLDQQIETTRVALEVERKLRGA